MNNRNRAIDQRDPVEPAASNEAALMSAVPAQKSRPIPALHLACEGDQLESDSLDIGAGSLPLFDTHGSRHLG
jgi:hypothetical protein